MKVQLEQRLIELRKEYESGQKILKEIEFKIVELENKKTSLNETLLRISGAIDLLEEVLGESACVPEPDKVILEVAVGDIEVPSVIKQPLEKARKKLEEAGLTAGEIIEQKTVLPIGIMAGEVIKQDPRPGVKLPAGSAVKLTIGVKGKFMPSYDKKSLCDTFSDRN
jgi:hypothetical protein